MKFLVKFVGSFLQKLQSEFRVISLEQLKFYSFCWKFQ